MTRLTALQPKTSQPCLPWNVKMQQKIFNRLRFAISIFFIICLDILINIHNANAYFFEGKWEVSLESIKFDPDPRSALTEVPQSYFNMPVSNKAKLFTWDIRYDGSNVYILSKQGPGQYTSDTRPIPISPTEDSTSWQEIHVSNLSYNNANLAFNVYEIGWGGREISVTRVHLGPGNSADLIRGEWQYKCGNKDIGLSSPKHFKINGTLYMRRIE